MSQRPIVSIITATLNRPSLRITCESVRAQSFTSWHHYVIGDGMPPTDYVHPQRTTIGFCRSIGAEEPSADMSLGTPNPIYRWALEHLELGKYVCFLDDDNAYLPMYLEKMVTALRTNPIAHIAICGVEDLRFPKRGQPRTSSRPSLYRVDNDFSAPLDGYPECGRCDNSGFLTHSVIAKQVGFPRATPGVDAIQDFKFISTIANLYGWIRVPERLVLYGVGPNFPPTPNRLANRTVPSYK
jgi:hypothetical protein